MLRHGWTMGVWLLLLALMIWYATLIPSFGSREISFIIRSAMPFVFLAVGQAVIVIAGGIDLSVGAMMLLANCVAAQYMEEQSFGVVLLIAVLVLIGAAILNGFVGWIINKSQVPDIVVTLATSFVFSGLALMVLPNPGGATHPNFRWIFTGGETGLGTNFWPSVIVIAVPVAVTAWWLRRTRSGLSLYATGSNKTAAFLSGLDTARTKIVAYAVGGAFAAMAGLSQTAVTGLGSAVASIGSRATLNSVAAIVLGGIALTGGIGSIVGAVAAGIILFFFNPILTVYGIDSNQAQVIQGVLIGVVMMVAGLLQLRKMRAS
jgi:ribose transport system permease protein